MILQPERPEGYSDPRAEVISDWEWRPFQDVKGQLGLKEIPSHVRNFGRYMDEVAKRAGRQGLTARDLIKAYTITRSSIQRQAVDADKVRQAGLVLPPDVTGKIRPEGAFGEWLHTPAGQAYLDAAERGQVHPRAIADAVMRMAPFGKHEKDIPDALVWAAQNLPGREKEASDLIAAARAKQSPRDQWRGFTKDVRGIGPSKAGFLASLMGRGDLPTLDARQVILHTGRPTKEASKYIARRSGAGGDEAVDRLAARQEAMGLKLPKTLSPYYQHLAHHAVWDKAGNEQTTHEDVMRAMRGAATGGAIMGDHPVVSALRQMGLKGLEGGYARGGSPDDDIVRQALERIASPFSNDPESVARALKIAQSYKLKGGNQTGTGSYYTTKQSVPVEKVTAKIKPIPGVTPKPIVPMTYEDIYNLGKGGGSLINVGGDRSNLGRMTHINGQKLAWPVDLHAGPNYMREPNPGAVWANAPGHATAFSNVVKRASKKGPAFGIYSPMGPRAVDSAHHMFDALMAQVPTRDIDPQLANEFDREIRQASGYPKAKRARARSILEKWPGVLNAKEASEFARKIPGVYRSYIVQLMDKAKYRNANFPEVGVTRAAITDPDVFKAQGNMVGHRIVQFDPTAAAAEESAYRHGTYPAATAGEYVGDVPLAQRHYVFPTVTEQRLGKPTKKGQIINPYSPDAMGRSSYRKLFEEQKQVQPITQEWLDSVMTGLENQKKYGFKRGGTVARALEITSKNAAPLPAGVLKSRQHKRGRP